MIHTPLETPVDQLWEGMRESGLPPIWLPSKQNFFEVPELPILGTGKIDLKAIKKTAMEKSHH